MAFTAAVLTVSDKGSRGQRVDTAGPAVADLLRSIGASIARTDVRPDERYEIATWLKDTADLGDVDLIVTTGGTGLAPRDLTPEATRDAIEREAPGLAEVMREVGRRTTPMAALSRGIVGTRGKTLIVNLPGSERGATESLQAILDLLPHAIEVVRGEPVEDHPSGM